MFWFHGMLFMFINDVQIFIIAELLYCAIFEITITFLRLHVFEGHKMLQLKRNVMYLETVVGI